MGTTLQEQSWVPSPLCMHKLQLHPSALLTPAPGLVRLAGPRAGCGWGSTLLIVSCAPWTHQPCRASSQGMTAVLPVHNSSLCLCQDHKIPEVHGSHTVKPRPRGEEEGSFPIGPLEREYKAYPSPLE
jgi:hypothetical protein